MMDMHSRKEYLNTLRERYLKAKRRKEKSHILDEYCRSLKPRRKRKGVYGGEVTAALAQTWEVFDYPCGQRLKPLLEAEVEQLRETGELKVSDEWQ